MLLLHRIKGANGAATLAVLGGAFQNSISQRKIKILAQQQIQIWGC